MRITGLRMLSYVLLAALVGSSIVGCERTPEDVERWRNSKREDQKLQTFATSSSESDDVRIRAFEILVEENHPNLIDNVLDKIEDKKLRTKLADAGADIVLDLWKKGDPPTASKDDEKNGVKYKPNDPSIVAKDSAYFLIPYASKDKKEKLRSILDDWLESTWKARSRAGKTSHGQLVNRASDKGVDHAMKWLSETSDVESVASTLRENPNETVQKKVAETLKTLADEAHPDLPMSLVVAIRKTRHEAIVPFLKKAIKDYRAIIKSDETKNIAVDAFRESLREIRGQKAATFYGKLLKDYPGPLVRPISQDLITVRGEAGILAIAVSMPTDKEPYESVAERGNSYKENAEFIANYAVSEMLKQDVDDITTPVTRALESDRWPAHVLGLLVAKRASECRLEKDACAVQLDSGETEGKDETENLFDGNWGEIKSAVKGLTNSRESIPAWGENLRIGELAHQVADLVDKAASQ